MKKYLAIILAIFGGWAVILQAIGFFSPAWMICTFGASSRRQDFNLYMGLWMTSACFDIGYEKRCETVSTAELEEKMALRGDPGEYLFIHLFT